MRKYYTGRAQYIEGCISRERMVLIMNYITKRLFAVAFVVSISLASIMPYTQAGQESVSSVEENVAQLLSTRKCPGCDLHGANLKGAQLENADLKGANLSGADLMNAELSGADLSNADLTNANLEASVLSNANLNGAKLDGARVINAGFISVRGLTPEQKDDLRKREAIVIDD